MLDAASRLTGWVEEPLQALLDELPLGVVHLDEAGRPLHHNPAALLILEGPTGPELATALGEMCARARVLDEPVETALAFGHLGEIRVLLAKAACLGGYLAVLERNAVARVRAENQVMRALLASATEAAPPEVAAHRALTTLGSTLAGSSLVLYQHDARTGQLTCLAHVGVPASHAALLSPRRADEKTSLVGQVMATRQPLHLATLSRAFFAFERSLPDGEHLSALALPVWAGGEVLGVLYVCGPRGLLTDGELKLVRGLADALGALVQHARLDADLAAVRAMAIQRDRLAMIGQLAAGVAHEINNPLSFVKANLSLIGDMLHDLVAGVARCLEAPQAADSKERTAAAALIAELEQMAAESLSGVDRIAAIVQSLKGLARSRPGEQAGFDPTPAVQQAAQFFTGGRHCRELVKVTLPALPRVMGEAAGLSQVVLNLLDNAFDALGGEGHITVRGHADGGRVTLEVRDDGPGIPPEVQPHLFEPFFTTKQAGKGTGLGLHISQQIVRGFGGVLRFETGPGGTTFIIELLAEQEED